MAKIYVIRDEKIKADVFSFMQQQDGAAGSYFYNWCLMQQHRDFSLSFIGELEYIEDTSGYEITIINRVHICNMPLDDEDE